MHSGSGKFAGNRAICPGFDWLTEIQDSLLYGRYKRLFSSLEHVVFVVKKDWLTSKNASRNGEVSLKSWNCFELGISGERTLAYSVAKVHSRSYPGDLVTRTGDREICSVSGRVGMSEINTK